MENVAHVVGNRYAKQGSVGETGKKETTWEILGADGMLILIYLIYLAQDKDEVWAYVNTVMVFRFLTMSRISLPAEDLLAFREGLWSMDFVC